METVGKVIRACAGRLLALMLISALLLICSCSSRDRVEGYIHYRLNHNPTTLDPAHIVDVTGGLIAAKLFNGLVRLDEGLHVIPDIAERWEVSPDGTTYVFHLKKCVYFHNNKEVNASDFKYSFERILSPKGRSPNSWVFDKIAGSREFMEGKADRVRGILVRDPYTLLIILEKPFSPFLYLLTMTAAYVVPREAVEQWGADFSAHPAGTGPYQLSEWKHNDRLLLSRNERYFGGSPKVSGISYRIIPEDLTAVTEFELGNLDVISVPTSEYQRFRKSDKWKDFIVSAPGINTYYLGFNCARPPFDDPLARKAVSLAIDRKKILNTFFENRGLLANGPVPPSLRSWSLPEHPAYAPDEAKKRVREAGLVGQTVKLYVTADQEVIDTAEIVQSYLRKAGISVTIRQLEWSSYKEALNKGEADMFWISWWADYPDPENFLFPLFHSSNHGASGNRTWYTNKTVDALVETGQRTADAVLRSQTYGKAEKIIEDELPWVSFWHKSDISVRQPTVRNFRAYPIYSMDKGLEVSF